MKKGIKTEKRKQETGNRGFTLVEVLVAIFILVIAVTGPMSAAQNSLRASFIARDQVVAYYLAQDAIEFLKNVRDYESYDNKDWTLVFTACMNHSEPNPKQCNIDTFKNTLHSCGSGKLENGINCNYMNIEKNVDGSEFFVVANADEVSKYKRVIFLDKLSDHEIEVVVAVEWDTNLFLANNRQIVLQENIYDWLPDSAIITP